MTKIEVLKREIVASNINDLAKGQLLLSIEAGELSDNVLDEIYIRLVGQREIEIAEVIKAKEANVNDNFIDLLKHMTVENFLESCKILHVKYGLKYGQIAESMRIAKTTMYAIGNGSFIPSEKLMESGIIAIKEYYLGQYYSEILERI